MILSLSLCSYRTTHLQNLTRTKHGPYNAVLNPPSSTSSFHSICHSLNSKPSVVLGSIPHPVMGTTRYYCRYIKVLLTPYEGAITIGGIDLMLYYVMTHEAPMRGPFMQLYPECSLVMSNPKPCRPYSPQTLIPKP